MITTLPYTCNARADGNLGRFNPTEHPQHFDPNKPWLGFMCKANFGARPEHKQFWEVWNPFLEGESAFTHGEISAIHLSDLRKRFNETEKLMRLTEMIKEKNPTLWINRPQRPLMQDINQLYRSKSTDNAIDVLALVHHGLKLMVAWCKARQILLVDGGHDAEELLRVPEASTELMGVWINGCSQSEAYWLLKNKCHAM